MLKKSIVSVETDTSLVGNSGGILTPEKRDGSSPLQPPPPDEGGSGEREAERRIADARGGTFR